jgi:pyocin large subunit-like protein
LRDSHPGKNILESKRQGGGITRFDVKRGYFGSYDGDGTIRTFFVPVDGVHYFERQGDAAGSRE